MPTEPIVLVIDGEIGAGKSTLIEKLRAALVEMGHRAVVVSEPVEDWKAAGILQAFYQAPEEERKHVAYEFQTFTFVTRVKEFVKVYEENRDAEIFILERSVLTDRYIFMELQRELVGDMLMKMYEEWWDLWEKLVPLKPTHHIYLKPDIAKCMERVERRHRDGEMVEPSASDQDKTDLNCAERQKTAGTEPLSASKSSGKGGVSKDYQVALRRAHEVFLEGKGDGYTVEAPVRVIGGSLSDSDFRFDATEITEEIRGFLGLANRNAQSVSGAQIASGAHSTRVSSAYPYPDVAYNAATVLA